MKRLLAAIERARIFCARYLEAYLEAYPKRMALVAGLILPLCFAPFSILPIFYLSYAIILVALWRARHDTKQLFILGWLFGFGQFFTGLIWMGEAFLVEAENFLWALPFAITLLPAGLALFPALAAAISGRLAVRFSLAAWQAALLFALAFSLASYLRSTILTGLPWNLPAMGWGSWLYLAQSVSFMGVHGLGLIALVSAALVAQMQRRMVVVGLALPLGAFFISLWQLHVAPMPPQNTQDALKIILIQPHIAQREKWQPEKRDAHIDKIFRLTKLAYAQSPEAQLIIWPETAIPALIDEGTGFGDRLRASFAQETNPLPYIMTGAIRREAGKVYNAVFLWRADGLLLGRSDKHHLVPFGEYLPLQNWLEAMGLQQLTRLRGGFTAGPDHARLSAARLPLIAPLICYEVIFPSLSGGSPRPALLANLTNDGWFGASFGPHQHLAQARLRAIEQGLPLVRSANTGISAAYDARGRLLDSLALGETGSLSISLPSALPPTPYARFGDAFYYFFWLFGLGVIFWQNRRGGQNQLP